MKTFKHMCPLALLSLLPLCQNLHAKGTSARIGFKVESEAPVVLVIVKTSEGVVQKNDEATWAEWGVSKEQWSTHSITIASPMQVDVGIRLSATWTSDDSVWVYIDNVKVDGADIKNPDFEDGTAGINPIGWRFLKNANVKAEYIENAGEAASGSRYVKLAFSCPATQRINLPANKEVTISFSAKLASAE